MIAIDADIKSEAEVVIPPASDYRSMRRFILAISLLFLTISPLTAEDRTVVLKTRLSKANERTIEIANPTGAPLTFTLGLNDQLFEDKAALLAAVRASTNESCRNLRNAQNFALPCAAYERVASWLYHFPELTDQVALTGWAPYARLWQASPLLAVNSFGFGSCGTLSHVLAKIWNELGYEVRLRELNGHTLTEVKVDGRWAVFDADLRGFFAEDGQVLGVDDLLDHPARANATTERPLPGRRKFDFPHAGLDYYPRLMATSNGSWCDVKDVPTTDDDWRDLTFTLPPGGRLLLPEQAPRQCLFPEYNNVVPDAPDFTDPALRYAIVTLPAGSVTTMNSGLFVARVIGDYDATVSYMSGAEQARNIDEIHRFRYARRFARNELRLHGDGIGSLRVNVINRNRVNLVAKLDAHPCHQPSKLQRLDVTKVTASSYSYKNAALAGRLIDQNAANGWISDILPNNAPQQILLDVGQPLMVRGVRWLPNADYGMVSPSSIEIDTSIDGVEFRQTDCVLDYNPTFVDWVQREFEPRAARYIRLMLTPAPQFLLPGRYQVSLGEVEVLH
jgi:hypothetical protein